MIIITKQMQMISKQIYGQPNCECHVNFPKSRMSLSFFMLIKMFKYFNKL